MTEEDVTGELLSILHHSLRASRRRRVIRLVGDQNLEIHSTRGLARKISSLEQGVPCERATGEPYRNVYTALSQTHLPTLATAEIIVYNPERQRVAVGPNFLAAELLLEIGTMTLQGIHQLEEMGQARMILPESITD